MAVIWGRYATRALERRRRRGPDSRACAGGALVGARSKGIVAGVKETLHLGDSVTGDLARRRRAVQGVARKSPSLHPHVESAPRARGCGQRSERARRGRAFQETGREATCAVVGQNAEPDARQELRSARTPLVASVALFSGALRRRPCPARPRHPVAKGRAAGRLHAASDHHRRERRPLLSKRLAGRRRQRHRDWRRPTCVSRSETTSRALRFQTNSFRPNSVRSRSLSAARCRCSADQNHRSRPRKALTVVGAGRSVAESTQLRKETSCLELPDWSC